MRRGVKGFQSDGRPAKITTRRNFMKFSRPNGTYRFFNLLSALIFLGFFPASCANFDPKSERNINTMVGAGIKYLSAFAISNDQIADIAKKASRESDAKERIAPPGSRYARRLARLTQSGKGFNFKVYLKPEVNAFAMPDGSIRVFSGLMDRMNDDELFFILGHEVSHIVKGHSQQHFRIAYSARATRELATMSDYGKLVASGYGGILEAVLKCSIFSSG